MKIASCLVTSAFVVVVLAGCSSSSKPPTVAGACAHSAQVMCAQFQRCAPGFLAFIGGSMAGCLSTEEQGCLNEASAPHVGLTAAILQSCADAIGGQSCGDFLSNNTVRACSVHGGTVANGGPCSSSWQCASGRCSALPTSCGTCLPQVAAGQACQGLDCADGLGCSATAPGSTSTVCTPFVDIGGACTDNAVCPVGAAFCDATTHVCTPLPKLGQPCDPQTTFFCDLTGPASVCDSTTSTCIAYGGSPVPVGAACVSDGGLGTICPGNCVAASDGGVPICQPYAGAGEACSETVFCAGGLACDSGTCGTCDGPASATQHRALRSVRVPGPFRRLRPASAFLAN